MGELPSFAVGMLVGFLLSSLLHLVQSARRARTRRTQRKLGLEHRDEARSRVLRSLDELLGRFTALAETGHESRKRAEALLPGSRRDVPDLEAPANADESPPNAGTQVASASG